MKLFSRAVCALFAAFIFGLGILTVALPSPAFSETENRYLAPMLSATPRSVLSGEYTHSIADFSADHIPFRTFFLHLRSAGEVLMGKNENNHTFICHGGHLIKRLELAETDTLKESIAGAAAIRQTLAERGIPAVFVCAPRAIDVMDTALPALYPKDSADKVRSYLPPSALFPADLLSEHAKEGETVFFHTDHHWTPLGAYYVYRELGEHLGYTPYSLSDFTAEQAAHDFFGTSASAAMFPFADPDTIVRYRYEGDDTLTVTDLSTGEATKGLYRDEFLEKKDKYAMFLGGNFAHLRITGDGEKPRLLLIKDSYANCMVPFLSRHFDIDLVDFRYVRTDKAAFLADLLTTRFDAALLLLNVETLSTSAALFGECY